MKQIGEKIAVLRKEGIFSETPEETLHALAEVLQEIHVNAGETIIHAGDEGNCMYLVVKGKLKVHQGEHTLGIVGKGKTIGEFSLVDPASRSASVTALESTKLFRLANADFHQIATARPEVLMGILREMVTRLRQQNQQRIAQLENRESELMQLVAARTAELAQKNREMELRNLELNNTLHNLQNTQQQLIESEKQAYMGKMLAHLAHEINTPIGIGITAASHFGERVSQFAERFKQKTIGNSDLIEFLEKSHTYSHLLLNNLQKAGNLVKRYKRLAINNAKEEKQEFSLKNYLEESLLNLGPQLRKSGVKVITDQIQDITVVSYPIAFWQIIANLVSNSLIHAFDHENGGTIYLSATEHMEGRVRLVYQDDGKGIPEDIIDKIFEPFFTTNLKDGTGLGLHIIHNMVNKELQGQIACESLQGNGVKFIIDLPKIIE